MMPDKTDWTKLGNQLAGPLVLPGDQNYTFARQLQNQQFDTISPRAVAYPETDEDVVQCLRFAANEVAELAVRSGGHSLGGYSTGKGLVLDLTRLNNVAIAPDMETVQLGPGVQQIDALVKLDPSGIAVVGGYAQRCA